MQIELVGDGIRISLSPVERLLSGHIRSEIEISFEHVLCAGTSRPEREKKLLRLPGTHIPSLIKAGTYFTRGGREFWYVTRDRDYLVLSLANGTTRFGKSPYCQVVVTVDGARSLAVEITERVT